MKTKKQKILTAKDFAAQEGAGSVRERIKGQIERHRARDVYFDTPFRDVPTEGDPVLARVDWGRWIADCECGGAEAVDPDEPVFYCFCCGNRETDGAPRLVSFPKNRQEIEAELLKRPVLELAGRNATERAFQALPVITKAGLLARNWEPGKDVGELRDENKQIKVKGR